MMAVQLADGNVLPRDFAQLEQHGDGVHPVDAAMMDLLARNRSDSVVNCRSPTGDGISLGVVETRVIRFSSVPGNL
jgi:hypothetical protein